MKTLIQATICLLIFVGRLVIAEEVRPICVRLLDATTKQPIRDIQVCYALSAARWRHILGIPIIEPVLYRDVVQERYSTDTNGCVFIPKRKIHLRLYERIDTEDFYINIDTRKSSINEISPVFSSAWNEERINPNKYFHGAILRTSEIPFEADEYAGIRTNNGIVFNVILKGGSLTNTSEQVIIDLQRKE